MLLAYKYRMYPTAKQKAAIDKHIDTCRFVYNYFLEQKLKAYAQDKQTLSCFELNKMLPGLKEEHPWIKETYAQALQMQSRNLDNAFKRFFRERKGFPKFKSKKNPVQSFQIPQNVAVFRKHIKLPKIGDVKCRIDRFFNGKIKTCTVSKTNTGKYYISVLVDDSLPDPEKTAYGDSNTVGVDVGLTTFATLSNGLKIPAPKPFQKLQDKLAKAQQHLSRKIKGSSNYKKAKQRVALIHERIRNQRQDFLHKLSFKLVSENQAIAIEDLNVSGMVKNSKLSKHIVNAAWSEFRRQLEYKCERYGKNLLVIGKFEPSSKLCSVCGYHNNTLKLAERVWTCPDCNANHDRDINAAINIKTFALVKTITGKGLPPFHRDSNNPDEAVPVRGHVRRNFS